MPNMNLFCSLSAILLFFITTYSSALAFAPSLQKVCSTATTSTTWNTVFFTKPRRIHSSQQSFRTLSGPRIHQCLTTISTLQKTSFSVLHAGGFEWEDPADAFDQGVDNPFKNPDLVKGDGGMKIDPARLLGPRLQGSNLYLIGMMGSGKSAVGDIVARRE